MFTKSFHNLTDTQVRAFQVYKPGIGWGTSWVKWISLRDRSLTYQFFPHFHPYVAQLTQRLNEWGIGALQDSDTWYEPQPNPSNGHLLPLTVLPNSTRAILSAAVTGTRPDGTNVSLSAGTPLALPDSATVTIPAGTPVAHPDGTTSTLATAASIGLPGTLPATLPTGIQWDIAGTPTVVPNDTQVAVILLPNPGSADWAVLTADGSPVRLPDAAAVVIRPGRPRPVLYEDFFSSAYSPDPSWVTQPYPVKNLDFTDNGAYSVYNWELFFHAPLLIAVHLSQNQKFQDAQNWFHYIFNPADNSPGPTPERFWKVLPFQTTDVRLIEQILVNLSTNQDPDLNRATVASIDDWRQHPFQPFAVARHRPTAYMLKTVMAYLDNLIAWGDSLFQQYTIETINEAAQLYVLAANILGPKPQPVPKKGSVKPLTYNDLRGKLDELDNTMADLEVDIPFDLAPLPTPGTNPAGSQILPSIGQNLYFCVPRNDKLLGYWDIVADRLFKIHNSLNLLGVFQRPPLYDPPIDPALLVRAAAAGLDVSAIVTGLNQPLPQVRFDFLVSKATELCQEVTSLGASILAAMEKQEGESLALLRAQHENTILQLSKMVKYAQCQDTTKARQGLEQSLTNTVQRYTYYQKLLGQTDQQIQNSVPQLADLDSGTLQTFNFSQADTSSEPSMPFDTVNVDIAQDSTSVSDGAITSLIKHEVDDLQKLSYAQIAHDIASGLSAVSAIVSPIPNFEAAAKPFGAGVGVHLGGLHLSQMVNALAAVSRGVADRLSYEAGKTSKLGSYERRQTEWLYQSNQAKGEINQIFKQLRGAQIREAIAQQEYQNHQTQMQQAQDIVDFLQGTDAPAGFTVKETTTGFYALMKREVKALYAKSFQLAFEVARKAERAMQHELGDPEVSYIQYNYLDGVEGLLAGEKLLFDLKAMEMAYHDLNQREYELTKHVSLRQTDPLALVQLRATGTCAVTLPEELFDLDGPGHYFRRIKSVAVTIPCVAGPYTSVNCTLTLQKSSIRISSDPGEQYARHDSDDPRFNDYYGTAQSIVTSTAQADTGLFEPTLRDDRYVPFERAGITSSQWQLTLPADVRQFDFDTITDVVLHVRYTAREGGDALRAAAVQNLQAKIAKAQTIGSVQLFSVRHEFPEPWAAFRSTTIDSTTNLTAGLTLTLLPQHYPFWAQGIVGSEPVKAVELFVEMLPAGNSTTVNVYDKGDKTGNSDTLNQNPDFGVLLTGNLVKIPLPAAVTDATHPPLSLFFDNNSVKDLWVAITWGAA
jgi:hypothetical protein